MVYGNDGCDGFAPNFPLIRAWRNQTAKHIEFCIIVAFIFHLVNGFIVDNFKSIKAQNENTDIASKA